MRNKRYEQCGGQYFDTRILMPLETVQPNQPFDTVTSRVLATDYNEQAIKFNTRRAKQRLEELNRLSQRLNQTDKPTRRQT